jgi:hypothetical protein
MTALQNTKKALEYDDEISEHDDSHSEEAESPKDHGNNFRVVNEYSF